MTYRSTEGIPAPLVPGDGLLHPLALASVALLALNDHVLKAACPGLLTGKLSDVAGLAFFPLVLLGAWEVALAVTGRWTGPRRGPLALAIVMTGIGFALVKTTPVAAHVFGWLLAAGQSIPVAAVALIGAADMPAIGVARVVVDPTDLLALPALLVAAWIGGRRLGVPGRASGHAPGGTGSAAMTDTVPSGEGGTCPGGRGLPESSRS